MDYVPGSIAALISGNITPNGPKITKRAFTPIKHQPSPNVTPKSESVIDRTIFLSPTLQKKKAIVKKSPKRIFQNQDFDITNDDDTSLLTKNPDVDKAKKRLKSDLEAEASSNKGAEDKNSPKKHQVKSGDSPSPKKKTKKNVIEEVSAQVDNETTPKKKKRHSVVENNLKECEDKENLKIETMLFHNVENQSPKKKNNKLKSMTVTNVNSGTKTHTDNETVTENMNVLNGNKSRKRKKSKAKSIENEKLNTEQKSAKASNSIVAQPETENASKQAKKSNKRKKKSKQNNQTELNINQENDNNNDSIEDSTQNEIKSKSKVENETNAKQNSTEANNLIVAQPETEIASKKTKKNKRKKKSKQNNQTDLNINQENDNNDSIEDSSQNEIKIKSEKNKKKNKKSKSYVNPNAITDKDTDSEHESDNEIESENEEINKKILESGPAEESSDEEEEVKKPEKKKNESIKSTNDEIKRTIFVGNVPFSKKCKKEMKKIFSKHGTIETIRIRTIPVKDASVTPKLAVIKNELHPDRSTVNVYIKYADESSVDKALVENNTILNGFHLRVSRSDHVGEDHDPRYSIFVGNMPFGLEDEALRSKFENCGEIESVRIIRDRKTNAGKGFGYVNFASKDGIELALAMSEEDLTIKNRILRVKRCMQTTKKSESNTQKPGNNLSNRKQGSNNYVNRNGGKHGGNNFQRKFSGGKNFGNRQGNEESKSDGAYRRIMNKRGNQDAGEGPPNKRPRNINQPKEKKIRKEYVGLTAEKKKKQKFAKGQKKKKVLSEILTKKS